jgi:hypothetical protein
VRGDDEPGDLPRELTDPAFVQRRAHVIESSPVVVPPSSPDRPPDASVVAVAWQRDSQPNVGRGRRPTRCCFRLTGAAVMACATGQASSHPERPPALGAMALDRVGAARLRRLELAVPFNAKPLARLGHHDRGL